MQTSEELIKAAHKIGTQETKDILQKSFPKLFKPFKNGDWIKSIAWDMSVRITNYENGTCYGFRSGIWHKESFYKSVAAHPYYWRKATDSEVIEAFEKEFRKKGFKEGVKFKDPICETVREFEGLNFRDFFDKEIIEKHGQCIYSNRFTIYIDGVFAKIVEEPKTIEQRLEVLEKFMHKVETNR